MTEHPEEYAPFCKTKRFDIFHHRVVRNPELGLPRDVYTAWHHSEDLPRPMCVVTVYPDYSNYVEWIEVADDYRREGIATEVCKALREKLGDLTLDGGTEIGEKFVAAKEKIINAKS